LKYPICAKCVKKYCTKESYKEKDLPNFCPMKETRVKRLIVKSREEACRLNKIFKPTVLLEKEGYAMVRGKLIPVRPRIKELIELAKKWEIKKIGIAFCDGFGDEVLKLTKILEKNNFEVYSVICKCGHSDKTHMGIPEEYKLGNPKSYEPSCNPILQAFLLNDSKTEINIIVGLCVGHDMIFTKYSKAFVTTLIVKDRYLGHNPYAGLYSAYVQKFYEEDYP